MRGWFQENESSFAPGTPSLPLQAPCPALGSDGAGQPPRGDTQTPKVLLLVSRQNMRTMGPPRPRACTRPADGQGGAW